MKKLKTISKYKGLDTELSEALRNGEDVKGSGVARHGGEYVTGFLTAFDCYDKTGHFLIKSFSGGFNWCTSFTPEYETEIDWEKVPVDTLIEITFPNGEVYHRYFHNYNKSHGNVICYANGKTSKTFDKNSSCFFYNNPDICKILEYPCTCKDKK